MLRLRGEQTVLAQCKMDNPVLLQNRTVAMGYGVWATPNGRRKGEPLSDGASPSQGGDHSGPTGIAGSILALHPCNYRNGLQYNIKFHPSCVQGEEGVARLRSFVTAFFKAMKGM